MADQVKEAISRPQRRRRKCRRHHHDGCGGACKGFAFHSSLYLRRPEAVSASAGSSIARAIDKLNYVPNLVAGGLAAASLTQSASSFLLSATPSLETVAAMQTALRKRRLQVILGHTGMTRRKRKISFEQPLYWAPATVVLTGLSHSETTRKMLAKATVHDLSRYGNWVVRKSALRSGFHHDQVGIA